MTTPRKQYLTKRDVCELLQVSHDTVERLVRRGQLRPIRIPSAGPRRPGAKPRPRLRFDPEELTRFANRNSKG